MKRMIAAIAAAIGLATGASAATIDLSHVASNTTIAHGDTVTGTLTHKCKISIADGATVTLSNVTITTNSVGTSEGSWAGITCLGSSTIILSGVNTVHGFREPPNAGHARSFPAIAVAANNWLFIQGDGSLTAVGADNAAGIGGGGSEFYVENGDSGRIVIKSGDITAIGGYGGAGIGGAYDNGTCGPITIEGGTVTAIGGTRAAGIGGEAEPEEPVEPEVPDEPERPEPIVFTDVPEDAWYHKSVKTAAEMGLINGKGGNTYAPNDQMTVAEAVKLAACMNIRYNGGDPATDIKNGTDVWYSTYMKYALDNGILDGDLTTRANEQITRAEYVYIFSRCLPSEAFKAVNDIPDGSIPDVANTTGAHKAAIYNFYRAGILNGADTIGTFKPSANISRGEVAAILVRMMDTTFRVGAPSQLNRNP